MTITTELGMKFQVSRAPEELADELLTFLCDGQWWTRKELQGWFTERELRLARGASKGRIISGQNGYKASQHATLDELNQAHNTLKSMARELLKQSIQLSRVIHGAQKKN